MTTAILDRHGRPAPKVTTAALRRRPGQFWKLLERRGAAIIEQPDGPHAVALFLDEFVSLLFGLPHRRPRRKRKATANRRRGWRNSPVSSDSRWSCYSR